MDGISFAGILALISRVLIGLFFVFFAFSSLRNWKTVVDAFRERGVPLPTICLILGVLLLLVFGGFLIFGYSLLLTAIVLIGCIVASTAIFHRFWQMEGEARRLHRLLFVTNLALIGAVILASQVS